MQFSKILIATAALILSVAAVPVPDDDGSSKNLEFDETNINKENHCSSKSTQTQICCNDTNIKKNKSTGLLAFGSLTDSIDINTFASSIKKFNCDVSDNCQNAQDIYCCDQSNKGGVTFVDARTCGRNGVRL